MDSYTYVSEVHYSTSWIDHCVSSSSAHSAICGTEVLHDFITSDYHPLVVYFDCTVLLASVSDVTVQFNSGVNWKNVTQDQKYIAIQLKHGVACLLVIYQLTLCCVIILCMTTHLILLKLRCFTNL